MSGKTGARPRFVETYERERPEVVLLLDGYNDLAVDTCIGVDGLHPTELGYRRMAETFFAAIVSDLETR